MPESLSQRKIAANRKNAKKSTGPITPHGKRRSSRNALRHGLLARSVVTGAAERQTDFDNLLADLVAELQPNGLIEETLVERIATCYWRLRRAQQFETATIGDRLDRPVPSDTQLAGAERRLDRAGRALETIRELAPLLSTSDDQLTSDDSQRCLVLLARFTELYPRCLLGRDPAEVKDGLREISHQIIAALESEIVNHREEIAELHALEARRMARRPLLKSVPNRDPLARVVRYETMLDGQLHRALAELRRSKAAARSRMGPRRHDP